MLRNACELGYERVYGRGDGEAVLRFRHTALGTERDLVRFAIGLAAGLGDRRGLGASCIELVLLPQPGVSVVNCVTVARCFGVPVNITIVDDASARDLSFLGDEGGDSAERDERGLAEPLHVSHAMVGCFAPPPVYRNIAREFLKGVDSAARYCMVNFLPGWPPQDVAAQAEALGREHPEWSFIVVGDRAWSGQGLPRSAANVIWPTRAGMDFRVQLALACEADAFIGPRNVLGLGALLCAKPVTLLDEEAPAAFAIAARMPGVGIGERTAVTDLSRELRALIGRTLSDRATRES